MKHIDSFKIFEANFSFGDTHEEKLNKLNDIEREVFDELMNTGDLSPHEAVEYAGTGVYYMDNENDISAIVADILDSVEEDNKPSETLLRVQKAIKDGRLKIVRSGKKKYGKLTLRIEEYVWGRNYMDGFGIDVYDERNNHEGTIRYLAPDYNPEIYKG